MSAPPRRAVLGAGVAGCALSYHLGRLGEAPLVIDPGPLAGAATKPSAGIVLTQLWDAWDIEVTRETLAAYGRIASEDGGELGLRRIGFVRTASSDGAAGALDAALQRWRSLGVSVDALAATELARRIPAGDFEDVQCAAFTPDDSVVDSAGLTDWYVRQARRAGATFVLGSGACDLRRSAAGWSVRTPSETFEVERITIAAGSWSAALLERVGHPLPLAPYRAQAAVVRGPECLPESMPSLYDLDSEMYVRPLSRGRVFVGDGSDAPVSGPDPDAAETETSFRTDVVDFLNYRLAGWDEPTVESAGAGYCVGTPDRRAIVGSFPEEPTLSVFVGLNDFGIMRADALARRLALCLTGGGDAGPLLAPVRVDRFPNRSAEFVPLSGCTLEGGATPEI